MAISRQSNIMKHPALDFCKSMVIEDSLLYRRKLHKIVYLSTVLVFVAEAVVVAGAAHEKFVIT